MKIVQKAETVIQGHKSKRQWQQAIDELNKILGSLQPTDKHFLQLFRHQLGHSFLQLKKIPEAIEHLSIALQLNGNDADSFIDRAEAYILQEDFEAGLFISSFCSFLFLFRKNGLMMNLFFFSLSLFFFFFFLRLFFSCP